MLYAQKTAGVGKKDPCWIQSGLIADRMGIGIIECFHWSQEGTEVGYTEAICRLQRCRQESQPVRLSSDQHTNTERSRQYSFRKMGRRSWYQAYHHLFAWSSARHNKADLCHSFVNGLGDIISGCTPRSVTRVWEGGGAIDQELRKYSQFVQYVARIE